MRFPEFRSKALTLSYDDAVLEDFRLIDIMKKYGLKGTFNINSAQYAEVDADPDYEGWAHRMSPKQATELYGGDGIEPAIHALTHANLPTLPSAQVAYEVLKDRENLEHQFGRIVRGMAYPYGTFSDEVVSVLRSCGIAYCRTTVSTERFAIPKDWLRMPATCHHKNARLQELTNQFLAKQHTVHEEPWLFYLWGHAYEFKRDNNWEVIEQFGERIGGKDDIWYATNIEVYEYVEAFRSLIFTLDMTQVHNPTAKTLWFILRGNSYRINAGETLILE